ncbi:STAS-like domain-containing protein [Pararhizobium haloflavum]|uniref:STAS-like domain-containing protein n=1 Tax=Pararhizobium haloflavum TaxID=2037914 RepID=UPI000C19930A|nr:DUF4325 domain-containing protein [Pararhizobium haloflavum]
MNPIEDKIDMLDIAADFSQTPGGRYKRHGDFSGELFREKLLAPRLRDAVSNGRVLLVRIDTVNRSYQSSFLDETFGGLVRDEGFTAEEIRDHLMIVSEAPRFQKYLRAAQTYIKEAVEEVLAPKAALH